MVRMLDAVASDFAAMTATQLKQCIAGAEGRTIAVEAICTDQSPIDGVSHGEIAASMGADIIVLDRYDSLNPQINGAPSTILKSTTPLSDYSKLLGRPVGVNLIVADATQGVSLGGRLITEAHVEKIINQGVQLINLYVRPKMGGTDEAMVAAASMIQRVNGDRALLIGVPSFSKPAPRSEQLMRAFRNQIDGLLDADCDGIALPMPGSKFGWEPHHASQLVDVIHAGSGLAWLFVTGSVEGAPEQVITEMALLGKQLGADAYRLDEAGLSGMPPPENIMQFSLAIRGKRHTYRRMAASILR